MKFLVTWRLHEGKLHDTLAIFAKMTKKQKASLMGGNVSLIGRWHDLVRGKGAMVCEAESAEAISAYALN